MRAANYDSHNAPRSRGWSRSSREEAAGGGACARTNGSVGDGSDFAAKLGTGEMAETDPKTVQDLTSVVRDACWARGRGTPRTEAPCRRRRSAESPEAGFPAAPRAEAPRPSLHPPALLA